GQRLSATKTRNANRSGRAPSAGGVSSDLSYLGFGVLRRWPIGQRGLQGILDLLEPDEVQLLPRLLGNVFEVLLVSRGKHDALDARPQRRKRLLLDPADRQYEASQADFSGHRDIVSHGLAAQKRRNRHE